MSRSIYEVQTWNDQPDSENRIHSDSIAQVYGFESALVAGVIVFGHMTYLPVRCEGIEWLHNNQAEVRFIKPAYDSDILTIEHLQDDSLGETHCISADRTLLASMECRHGEFTPRATVNSPRPPQPSVKPHLDVDTLQIDDPWPGLVWTAEPSANVALAEKINDDNDIYRGATAPVHPYWLLHQCNEAVMQAYLIPAWIHVGSKITFFEPIQVGAQIETHVVPVARWERKNHSFVTLLISFGVGDRVRVEVEHTAIFRIAPPASLS